MKIDFSDRSGIPLMADFYTLSTFYDKNNFLDCEIAKELLPKLRKEILQSAATAIFSEIGYYRQCSQKELGHIRVFDRFGVAHIIEELINHRLKQRFYYVKKHKSVVRMISAAKNVFLRPNAFISAYGGPKWAEICKKWLILNNFRDFDSPEMFGRIDNLIDASHNTGRCLNKVYFGIDDWLSTKTNTKNPFWVVEQSVLAFYAAKRMKQRYNFTVEHFQKQNLQWIY